MVFRDVKEDNKLVVNILIFLLALNVLLYVVYPPLRTATGIYGFLVVIALGVYTNGTFQDYLIGIKKSNLFKVLLIGAGFGLAFVILPRFIPGMSMGIPLLPAAVEDNLKWVVICLFAPIIEEILTRGALLGLVKYMERNRGISTFELWVAIIAQAIFFTLLHATSYAAGWYEAPTWMGAFGTLSAVSASLLAAFLFGVAAGWFVTRDGIENLGVSIVAHYIINQILFVQMSVVGLSIFQFIVSII